MRFAVGFFLVAFLSFGMHFTDFAAADPVIVNCKQTPGKIASKMDFKIHNSSNDLLRKPGYPDVAEGEVIYIRGKVLDSRCIPVPNAKVMIYHANHQGKYQLGTGGPNEGRDPNFRGLGTFITNNMGDYSFITVMPGVSKDHPPRVHFFVEHKDFMPFETVAYFSSPTMTEVRSFFSKNVSSEAVKYLVAKKVGDRLYSFNIALGGSNQYLHY